MVACLLLVGCGGGEDASVTGEVVEAADGVAPTGVPVPTPGRSFEVATAVPVGAAGLRDARPVLTPWPTAWPTLTPAPIDDLGAVDIPPPFAPVDDATAAAAESVVSELIGFWFWPGDIATYADLAAATAHLTTGEWSQVWVDARPQVLARSETLDELVEVRATVVYDGAALVSVTTTHSEGGATWPNTLVFDLVATAEGWKVSGLS